MTLHRPPGESQITKYSIYKVYLLDHCTIAIIHTLVIFILFISPRCVESVVAMGHMDSLCTLCTLF